MTMITVVEKEIHCSSLCFYGTTRDTPDRYAVQVGTGKTLSEFFGQTFALDTVSGNQMIYRNRDPRSDGSFPPTPKIVTKISIEPMWTQSNISPEYPSGKSAFFADVKIQPYIATQPLNDLTQNFFAFSATNDVEWELNQWSPSAGLEKVNDVHFDDKFVLQPWEDLKVRLLNADLSGTLQPFAQGNSTADNARWEEWRVGWKNSAQPAAKIRIEMKEFVPSSQYYHRTSLNDIKVKGNELSATPEGWQEVTLLDFRSASLTLKRGSV